MHGDELAERHLTFIHHGISGNRVAEHLGQPSYLIWAS
jgi:hypothetical protein